MMKREEVLKNEGKTINGYYSVVNPFLAHFYDASEALEI